MCRRCPWLWNQDPWVKVMCSAEASARAADILASLQAPETESGRHPCRHQRQQVAAQQWRSADTDKEGATLPATSFAVAMP